MATFFDKQSGKAERTKEQIEAKKQQLKKLSEEILSDDELDGASGGSIARVSLVDDMV